MTGKDSNAPITLKHVNACSSVEDEEEGNEEKSKEGYNNKKTSELINKHIKYNVDDMISDQSQNILRNYKVKNVEKKTKVKVNVEDMSAEQNSRCDR